MYNYEKIRPRIVTLENIPKLLDAQAKLIELCGIDDRAIEIHRALRVVPGVSNWEQLALIDYFIEIGVLVVVSKSQTSRDYDLIRLRGTPAKLAMELANSTYSG